MNVDFYTNGYRSGNFIKVFVFRFVMNSKMRNVFIVELDFDHA